MRTEKRPDQRLWEVQPGWRLACLLHVGIPPGYLEMEVSELVGGLCGLESFQDHFSPGPGQVSGLSFPRPSQIDSPSLIRFANQFLQPLKGNSLCTRERPC